MLPKFIKSGSRGFSLVELMIVVAIIGVLSALAVPRFQKFQAKAKQSEAKGNLSHIYTLAQSWYGDQDTYVGTLAGIGFTIQGNAKDIKYTYAYAGAATTFTGTATAKAGIVGGCATVDTWTINENKSLNPTTDAVATCP